MAATVRFSAATVSNRVRVSSISCFRDQDGCWLNTRASNAIANGNRPHSSTTSATRAGSVTARGARRINICWASCAGSTSNGTATTDEGRSPNDRRLVTNTTHPADPGNNGTT